MAQIKKKFIFDNPEDSYWNESGSNSSSLFDDLPSKQVDSSPMHAGGPSAASVMSECSISSLPSDAHRLDLDYSRLKAEHRKLQRHLEETEIPEAFPLFKKKETVLVHLLEQLQPQLCKSETNHHQAIRYDRYRAPDVKEAVRRLLKGDPVSLEWYRTKLEKIQLLDAAVDVVDGNVILAVVLFLKNSLMDSLFRDILLMRPRAAEEYLTYLKTTRDHDELANTLFALGRNADAAMVEYSAALRHQVADQKVF
ncbi:unnamed protein product [Nippostrongylus brasiliensis]|uniref:Spermatogenesis-defective protein 39 (inferred by orthology to a C. elegans protein) n=1 Tax=Nippostrongylus brasiliensis TaxID=27835 RepID=A0A0N4Y8L6_NIPBR|nr:unnamed protein product [Nippostrongylus brasiliensis]